MAELSLKNGGKWKKSPVKQKLNTLFLADPHCTKWLRKSFRLKGKNWKIQEGMKSTEKINVGISVFKSIFIKIFFFLSYKCNSDFSSILRDLNVHFLLHTDLHQEERACTPKKWNKIFFKKVSGCKAMYNNMHLCLCVKLLQSCTTLCDPVDCSMPGSSVHRTLQARILEWVAKPSSRGSSPTRDGTCVFYISCTGRWVLYHWATWEPHIIQAEVKYITSPQRMGRR